MPLSDRVRLSLGASIFDVNSATFDFATWQMWFFRSVATLLSYKKCGKLPFATRSIVTFQKRFWLCEFGIIIAAEWQHSANLWPFWQDKLWKESTRQSTNAPVWPVWGNSWVSLTIEIIPNRHKTGRVKRIDFYEADKVSKLGLSASSKSSELCPLLRKGFAVDDVICMPRSWSPYS